MGEVHLLGMCLCILVCMVWMRWLAFVCWSQGEIEGGRGEGKVRVCTSRSSTSKLRRVRHQQLTMQQSNKAKSKYCVCTSFI